MEIYIWMNDASTSPRGVTEKKWHRTSQVGELPGFIQKFSSVIYDG